ncbi:formin-1-like isoform X2 [Portunus trituberculatus]|uniref:formin-1-like isoform X2 n=1 Tax=Portunus trituberculatus TaxID=210409 RepID=UPI001E1CC939|nr:formin-1-like isoform X2 [Portunus trituberculatus]
MYRNMITHKERPVGKTVNHQDQEQQGKRGRKESVGGVSVSDRKTLHIVGCHQYVSPSVSEWLIPVNLKVKASPTHQCLLNGVLKPNMDATEGTSSKGGIPLLYPSTPYALHPGLYMYPPNPMPYVIPPPPVPPPPPPPPVCLPPHAAMKGHDLYFSGQHGAPRGPGMGSVRGPWSYQGQPLVEGTLDHGPYMMPPMPALFLGTPYSYYPPHYAPPVPQHPMHQRETIPRSKIISIEDVTDTETEEESNNKSSDGNISLSLDNKLQCDEDGSKTNEPNCLKDKDSRYKKKIFQENVNEKKDLTESTHEKKNLSSAKLTNVASKETAKSVSTRNKTVLSDCGTYKKKERKENNDKVFTTRDKARNLYGFGLYEETDEDDKGPTSGKSQTTEKMREHLRLKDSRTHQMQVKGVITEVHCSMGKLRLQSGKEYYFSPNLCFLYGVSLADLELWHVLIEGQQVKVTLNDINSELPKVTRITVEEEDCDSDPDATTLNIQQWCSSNCVPEEATVKLIQQVKGLH